MAYVAPAGGDTYALTGDLFTSSTPLVAWFESAAEDTARSCRVVASSGPDLRLLPAHGKVRADGRDTLLALAALMDEMAGQVDAAAARSETRDYARVAREVFGDGDAPLVQMSNAEYSYTNFVRSVFDPVRSLPASHLRGDVDADCHR